MWKWLLALWVFLFSGTATQNDDYVGRVAAEAAYSSMMPNSVVVKPKVPTKDCTTCNGTGRVRTGDDNNPWTKCPDCDGNVPGTGDAPSVKIPKSDPNRYNQPGPSAPGTRLVR